MLPLLLLLLAAIASAQAIQSTFAPVTPPKLSLFFCHQMIPGSSKQISTFEFRNPQGNTRGVACVIALDEKSAYIYVEEESRTAGCNEHSGALGFASRTPDGVLTGNLWKFGASASDGNNPILPFTIDTGRTGNFWSLQISGKSFIWHPRTGQGVANWQMSTKLLPRTCPDQMHRLAIIDPIPRSTHESPDREGFVCVKAQDGLADFFAVGWRRVEGSGKLRKFVNFGRMRRSVEGVNSFDGKLINFAFATAADQISDLDRVRLELTFKAIPSRLGHSLLLLGDLREKWISPELNEADVSQEIYII